MKKLITLLLVLISFISSAQSFSDYKEYVLSNDCFKVVSRITDTTICKNKKYYAQIVRPKILESGYLFVIIDDKGNDRYFPEMEFIKSFMITEEKK